MNSFIVFYKNTGEIISLVTTTNPIKYCNETSDIISVGDHVDYIDKWVVDGVLVPLPERPSVFHIFDYTTKQWIDPRTNESEWAIVRDQRNALLAQSDWTQLPDVPLATKEAWATYRQALRDITNQPDPFNIVWPTPPA